MRLEATCEPILTGRTEDGWAVHAPGARRYYVQGLRVPRLIFRAFVWVGQQPRDATVEEERDTACEMMHRYRRRAEEAESQLARYQGTLKESRDQDARR